MQKASLIALATFDGSAGTENMSSRVLLSFAKSYEINLWTINREGHFYEELEPHIHKVDKFLGGRFSGLRNMLRLMIAILGQKPKVVLVFDYKMAIILAGALRWLPKAYRPRSIFCHHVHLKHRLKYAPCLEHSRVLKLFPRYDVHTVPSLPVADELHSCLPNLDPCKVHVVANGINLPLVEKKANKPIHAEPVEVKYCFICLGSLRTDKHVDKVLKAFSKLPQRDEALLWVVGDGPDRGKLENMAKTLGIQEQCFFLGALDNPYPYLARATLLVHVSERETFGLVALEAMAIGTPILAMCEDTRGLSTVLQSGVQGMLIEGIDVQVLVSHWEALLENDQKLRGMGEEGLKRAKDFEEKVMAGKLLKLANPSAKQ